MTDRIDLRDVLQDVETLFELHKRTQTDPTKCREFNSRASILLEKIESLGIYSIADRMMDILGSCSPKDFSHCDNHYQTNGSLERLKEKISKDLDNGSL